MGTKITLTLSNVSEADLKKQSGPFYDVFNKALRVFNEAGFPVTNAITDNGITIKTDLHALK